MKNNNKIKIFEDKTVRTAWNETEEEWYFNIVDVVNVFTEQKTLKSVGNYWRKLKERLKKEGNQSVTNCHTLKMLAQDEKMRKFAR